MPNFYQPRIYREQGGNVIVIGDDGLFVFGDNRDVVFSFIDGNLIVTGLPLVDPGVDGSLFEEDGYLRISRPGHSS